MIAKNGPAILYSISENGFDMLYIVSENRPLIRAKMCSFSLSYLHNLNFLQKN